MKPNIRTLATGLLVCLNAGAAYGQTQPVLKPIDKPPFDVKMPTAEDKAKLGRENAQKRFKDYKDRWDAGWSTPAKPVNVPLKFEDPVRDIGRVNDDGKVKVVFNFKNISDHTVKVMQAKPGCGCTVAKAAKDSYAPGEEGSIEAMYDPKGRRGLEFKDIDVQLDSPPGLPQLKIGFLVETLPRVVAEPANVFMPDVRKGAAPTQKLTITGREAGFDVTSATLVDANAPFTITRVGKTESQEDSGDTVTRVEYEVALKPGQAIGAFNTKVVLATTDPSRATMDVNIGAMVVGDVRMVPDRLTAFGQAGTPFAKEIRLDHRVSKPFHILGVQCTGVPHDAGVVLDVESAEVTGAPGEVTGYKVKVAGTFPAGGGNFTGKVILRTDVPDQPVIEIPFQGVITVANKQ
jgi:hypothetical protein